MDSCEKGVWILDPVLDKVFVTAGGGTVDELGKEAGEEEKGAQDHYREGYVKPGIVSDQGCPDTNI